MNDSKNTYVKFGPNDNLNILGVKIDTWTKYCVCQVALCIFQIADTIIQEFANPILGFNIYNPDKKVINDFTKFQLQFYAQSFWFINNIKGVLMLIVSVTQLDLAISKTVYSEVAGIYTINALISEKTFSDSKEDEINVKLLDNDSPC